MMLEKLTKKAWGCFKYTLKDHKPKVGEFAEYEAFFDYSMAVKRLGEYEDTGLTPEQIQAQQQEIDRLQRWVNDLQSGMYVNCVYCGHRYGMENDTPVAMADVLKEHIEHCSKHPMSKLKQEIERLRDENASIRNWNACEEEQYGQLLESDKRRIKLEEQIEAQQQEIKQLEYTLKKARDLIENANSNGILEHVARNCMFIKEIDDLLGGKEDV